MSTSTKSNFEVRFLNSAIGPSFFEEGFHNNYTDQGLLDWFLERQEKSNWAKITDIEIKEKAKSDDPIERTDLVMKIIKPRIFKEGEKVRAVFFDPLPGNNVMPDLNKEEVYTVKGITWDSKGNQHIDIGIESEFEFIRSYETGEHLPKGNKIHWVHPGRLELVA